MLTGLFSKFSGYKTYILAGVGVLIGVVGHFFGPINIGSAFTIPQLSWQQVWDIVWNGGLFAALRNGITTEAAK